MRTTEEIEAIKQLVLEVERRGIVLTDTLNEWMSMAYSLAEGGEEMRDSFHTLARMGSNYHRKDSDRLFNSALRKAGSRCDGQEMSYFLSKCWAAGLQFPDVLKSHQNKGGASASSATVARTSSMPSPPAAHPSAPTAEAAVCRIDPCYVQRCRSDASSFMQSVVSSGLLTSEQAQRAAERYRLGAMRNGAVIYWQIDAEGQVRDGKVMQYGPDCHRLKSVQPNWMGWLMRYKLTDAQGQRLLPPQWRAEQCLFGLHLLAQAPPDQPVCITEAEKTAVFCSERVDAACLWMASGGLAALNAQLLLPLRGRRIMLYPDTDAKGEAFRLWCDIAERARRDYHLDVAVSDLLEREATAGQKARKVDLVEWVVEEVTASDDVLPIDAPLPPELLEMMRDYPDVALLVERFGLTVVKTPSVP